MSTAFNPARQATIHPGGNSGTEPKPPAPAIPMAAPDLTEAERRQVSRVLETPVLSFGPQLAQFEQAVAGYIGVAHAVGVNSGTSGLHLALIAAGVGEGDLVITTPFSFIASANCILYQRAVPVFVDVEPATGNIDPALVAEAVHDLARAGTARRWLPPNLRGNNNGPGSSPQFTIHHSQFTI